ncbi:E3 ubiquitin-protein ligase pellino 2 [Phytophthora pseudosyringae]|uniref:E3 ubiquitin-protein ligase pellino 2 n=1 Tax=Phytophthora pseudosyringae TaxID=221518 RepID=A0A8T1WFY4_9STRA|nr:E3 ubiquitin-protein ligase pellino 2 [Phytophthora pseudosyringae]
MEYGRLVVLGYSSYRVDVVQRPRSGSVELAPPSFGLADAGDEADGAPSSAMSRKRSLGQLWKPLGGQNAHYALEKRPRANGIRLHRFHHVIPIEEFKDSKHRAKKDLKGITTRIMQRLEAARSRPRAGNQSEDDFSRPPAVAPYQMCVPMNDKDPFASVTEFHADPGVDMFQIGRMPCRQNDFVIPGPRVGASGTISRYAARIVCSREPPFECRVFAGGFDAARRMSTAGHALKHCARCGAWSKRVGTDHSCVMKTMMEQAREDERDGGHFGRSKKSNNRPLSGQVQHYIDDTSEDGPLEHFELDVRDASELPLDGLTKNGVRVWLPERKQWFEVSVNGRLYAIESRPADATANAPAGSSSERRRHHDGTVRSRSGAFNRPSTGAEDFAPILTDGAVIDLGGVQLQFQTNFHSELEAKAENSELLEAPVVYGRATLSSISTQLERLNVQCPVQLHSLRFTRADLGEEVPLDQIPHVFPACGHVFGYEKRIASSHTCPLCRAPGSLVQLLLKENSQLQSAEEQHAIPECVFNPCGHAISTKLAHHYSALPMPNGRAICPFCAVHLDLRVPFSRLYLYCDSD